MFWTRVMGVAMATLMIGAISLAQEAKPEKTKEEPGKTAAEGAPAIDPNKAPEGKLKVATTADIAIKDEARKKDVTLTAIYPEEAGKYPVIIFSHGAGAQVDAGTSLGEYWASHGFVVLIPKHADARKSMSETMLEQYDKDNDGKISKEEAPEQMQAFFDTVDKDGDGFLSKEEMDAMGGFGRGRGGNRGNRGGQPEQPEKPKEEPKDGEDDFDMLGDPAEILLEDPAEPAQPAPGRGQGRGEGRGGRGGFGRAPAPLDATAGVDRVADIKLLLDNAAAIVKAVPALKDKMDLEHVGVSGHNHGAYTAELIGGATVNVESTVKAEDGTETKTIENRNLADSRVKAILALSPAGAEQGGLSKESFKGIKIPAMTMTGSNDNTGEGQDAAWKKQAYELAPEGGKYHVFIEGARNNSFTSQPRAWGRGGEQPATDNTFEWVKTSTLEFWNATLKGDAEAVKWLEGDALKESSEGKAAIEHK